jgi:hypothetical protein
MLRFPKILALLLVLLSACAPAAPTPIPEPTVVPTPVPGTLFVDAGTSLGPISPYIFGSNYGPWIAVAPDMLEAAYNSGVTILRFPAGEWGDKNDVKDYQLDQLMEFAGKMGADVMFSVRLKGGTPEQAAGWVRYAKDKKYPIRYWSIGNEPTLYSGDLKRAYDTEEFNREWRTFAQAMKKADPSILLLGPELHQFTGDPASNPKDSQGKDWMTEFLRANGDLVDVVAIHRYPYPRNEKNATIADLRENSKEWDTTIAYLRDLIHRETGRDLPIAVTEINSHYSKAVGGEATPDSHYNAIWLADVLGRMIRNRVLIMNHWMLTSKGGYGGWGLVERSDVYPSYHVYQLYREFGSELVYSSSPDPDVTVYAAKRADGALTIVVINLADAARQMPLTLQGAAPGPAETWRLDLERAGENVGVIDLSLPLDLPPQSMSMFVLGK